MLESWLAWNQSLWDYPADLYLRSRLADPSEPSLFVPPDQPSDRRRGDWPLYSTEMELGRLRMRSKLLAATNAYARGLLKNLVNYVVGDGCQYEIVSKEQLPDADPAAPGVQAGGGLDEEVAATQDVVDEFLGRTRWNASEDHAGDGRLASTKEREIVRRVIRDGECIIRLFYRPGGILDIRFVEPAQLRNPPGKGPEDGWLFGIRHEDGDEETPVEYHFAYKSTEMAVGRGDVLAGEFVPADEVVHLTGPDTDAVLCRGLPEFSYDAADALERAAQLERSASGGANFRACMALVWQHAYGTPDQINALTSGLASGVRTNPLTNRTEYVDRPRPQTVVRVPEGQEMVPLPQDQTESYLLGVQGDLRQAASAVCAPEYLASGDASNANYASTKEAGTPFIQASKALQSYFTTAYKRVVWKALKWAADNGRLSPATLELIDLKVEASAVIHQNDLEKAQRDQILLGAGVVDAATLSMEWGYDPEVVEQGLLRRQETMGGPGGGLDFPDDGPAGGGGGGDSFGESKDPRGHEHKGRGPGGGQFTGPGGGKALPGVSMSHTVHQRQGEDGPEFDVHDPSGKVVSTFDSRKDAEEEAARLHQQHQRRERLAALYRSAGSETPVEGGGAGLPAAGTLGEIEQAARSKFGDKFGGVYKRKYGGGDSWQIEIMKIKDGYHGRQHVLIATYQIRGSGRSFGESRDPHGHEHKGKGPGGGQFTGHGGGGGASAGHGAGPTGEGAAPDFHAHREALVAAAMRPIKGVGIKAAVRRHVVRKVLGNDAAVELIPRGSAYIGGGFEAIVFKTPAGDVVRLEPDRGPRPEVPEVLQPTKTWVVGEDEGKIRVERLPFAKKLSPAKASEAIPGLHASLAARGYVWTDDKTANVGLVGGEVKIIDPGNIVKKATTGGKS